MFQLFHVCAPLDPPGSTYSVLACADEYLDLHRNDASPGITTTPQRVRICASAIALEKKALRS
jgi:hypothetical protein